MTSPIPYIDSLRRDADGFANLLHWLTLTLVVALLTIMGGHWLGWWGAPSETLRHSTRNVIYFWLAFRAVCAVVDYAIYAAARASTELMSEIVKAVYDSIREHYLGFGAGENSPVAPADHTEQSFFTDAMARSQSDDPEPPTAA